MARMLDGVPERPYTTPDPVPPADPPLTGLTQTTELVARLQRDGAFAQSSIGEPLRQALERANEIAGSASFLQTALTSQNRIAEITASMREPFLKELPYIPSAEVVATQGVREAIVALGELLEEQVKETVRLAELQAETARIQASGNDVMTYLTAALVTSRAFSCSSLHTSNQSASSSAWPFRRSLCETASGGSCGTCPAG